MIRWAILGTGFISRTMAEAIAASQGSHIEAIGGRDETRARAFAASYGCDKSYAELDDLLADPQIDIVYIGLPNHLHHQAVIACAHAGKAVLCEKSLVTTMAQADAVARAVRDSGIFFMEGLMYLNHPVIAEFGRIIRSGRLGTLRSITGLYAADIWKLANREGGGTIFNLGCYPISLMHYALQCAGLEHLLGHRTVTGSVRISPSTGVPVDAAVTLQIGDAVQASILCSDGYGLTHSFEVHGEAGSLRFRTNPWLPVAGDNILTIEDHGGAREDIIVASPLDAFGHQVQAVERFVTQRTSTPVRPSPRLADSLEIVSILTQWQAIGDASAEGFRQEQS